MIPPGATIGVLGGGQLGRMLALAARPMGYRVVALDPDPEACARGVVDELIVASLDDVAAGSRLAARCDVVTLEIEKVSPEVLDAVAARCPLRPGAGVLARVRDRGVQRRWLAEQGAPQGPFRLAEGRSAIAAAVAALGGDCFIKSRTGGYDGRGQIASRDGLEGVEGLGPVVIEQALPLEGEISVLVARRPSGEVRVYPPAWNHHEARILSWSLFPAPIPPDVASEAMRLGVRLAEAIGLEGILAVELFWVSGRLLVNELAPRPHNSFHATIEGCVTSQFAQHVRAICDLPLGSVEVVRPTRVENVLGDRWFDESGRPISPDWSSILEEPGAALHLYGKAPRPGRKVGHWSRRVG